MNTFRNLSITIKLTLGLVLFAAGLLAVVGVLAYSNQRASLEAASRAALLSTAIEKQAALDAWLDEELVDITELAHSPALRQAVAALRAAPPGSDAAHRAYDSIIAELAPRARPDGGVLDVLVMEPERAEVIAATNDQIEGQFKEDRPYFINGKSAPTVQGVYYSVQLQSPAITVAAPLKSDDGELLAVLAAHLNLNELNDIILRRSGLRESEDALLVNPSRLPVTQPRFMPDRAVLQRGIHSTAVNRCLQKESATGLWDDYRGVSVIGAFRWIEKYDLCLVVKIDQQEAFAPVHEFARNLLIVGALLLGFVIGFAALLARTFTRPIVTLQQGAAQFGAGALDTRLPETSGDELGDLARGFNRMAEGLEEKEAQLRAYAAELEQRVAERTGELRVANERYEIVTRATNDVVWDYRPTLQQTVWNENINTVFGYALREFELPHTWWYDKIHPDDGAAVEASFKEAIQERRAVWSSEYRFRRGDDTYAYVYDRGYILRDADGKPQRVIGAMSDFSARKRAEQELETNMHLLESIANATPDVIYVYDLIEHRPLYNNRQVAALLGYTPKEIQAMGAQFLPTKVHPEDWERVREAFGAYATLRDDELFEIEYRMQNARGEWRWFSDRNMIFARGADGSPTQIIGTSQDVTERKRAETALMESKEHFRRLFDEIRYGFALHEIICDDSGKPIDYRFLEVNPAFEKLTGLRASDLIGRTVMQVLPETESYWVENYGRVALTGAPLQFSNYAQELDRYFEVSAYRPGPGQFAVIFMDVTERNRVAEALKQSERRYRSIFDAAPVSIWLEDWTDVIAAVRGLGAQGVVSYQEYLNEHAEFVADALSRVKILDVNAETLSMFHARAKPELLASLNTVFATDDTLPGFIGELVALGKGESIYRTEMALRTVPGDLIHVLLTMSFPPQDSTSGEVLVSLMDITDIKRAKDALSEANERAIRTYEKLLERLTELAQRVGTASELSQVFRALRQFVELSAPASGLFASRYDPLSQERICIYAWSEGEEYDPAELPPMPMTDSPHSRAVATGEVIVTDNLIDILSAQPHVDLGFERDPRLPASSIAVPLKVAGRVIGGFEVQSVESGAYMQEHVTALAMAANLAAIATENVRLFGDERAARQHAEQLADAVRQLNAGLEVRVRERTAELEDANKELEAFAYSVSHDLRAPLRAIDGFARILHNEYASELSPNAQRYLGLVRGNAAQMGMLVDDLLTFSRLNRQPLTKQRVAMSALVQQVLEELADQRQGRAVEIVLAELPDSDADSRLLKQVWLNLLGNAHKFTRTRETAVIEIGATANGELHAPDSGLQTAEGESPRATCYFVRDNGVGFDMRYAHKLFGVFQRLHRAEDFEGTGVGLAIVQRIVHRHGGRVWADAVLDRGATFYFTL